MGLQLLKLCNSWEKVQLLYRLIIHDYSKFSKIELLGYYYFWEKFRNNRTEEVIKLFNLAWNHHQKLNDHHWEYWLLLEKRNNGLKVLPMSKLPLLEMMADWASFRMNHRETFEKWYKVNKDNIILNNQTVLELENYYDAIG